MLPFIFSFDIFNMCNLIIFNFVIIIFAGSLTINNSVESSPVHPVLSLSLPILKIIINIIHLVFISLFQKNGMLPNAFLSSISKTIGLSLPRLIMEICRATVRNRSAGISMVIPRFFYAAHDFKSALATVYFEKLGIMLR